MDIHEIKLMSGRVLLDNHPPSPPEEVEEEKEEGNTQIPEGNTPEETEILGELKILCVKIPLL